MRKSYSPIIAFLLMATLASVAAIAQNVTITGNVKNSKDQEIVPAVSITVKGSSAGSFTDDKGNFRIVVPKLPVVLVFSSVGFSDKELQVTSAPQGLSVGIEPSTAILTANVVVSGASRMNERLLESPVSIERVGTAAIRNTAASSYYDIIGNIKGVDLVTASLLFKTPSTRGFNTSGNLRLNQLVDGMDNQAPGLNFPVGTLVGVTELDVESMEMLLGASSALYGPGGMNGTLLINSKNPFKYQGLSWQVKQGIMHVDNHQRDASPFFDWTLRWAKKVSEKFAFKIGGQFTQAKDWVGTDYRNYPNGLENPATGNVKAGERINDPNYNGINVYGDETNLDLAGILPGPTGVPTPFLQGFIAQAAAQTGQSPQQLAAIFGPYLAGPLSVSRTGYKEVDVVDPTTLNIKLNGALHYKVTPAIEASLSAYYGYGNTVYTGSDRYSLQGVKIGQYKAEIKHNNWFFRAYTTQENAGESYNATVTTRLFNEAWKPSANPANLAGSWYPQYMQVFGTAALTTFQQAFGAALAAGQPQAQAFATAQNAMVTNTGAFHNAARAFADQGRPAEGSPQFKSIFDKVSSLPISKGGGKFLDRSNLYMTEGQYNFTEMVKVAEVLVGANYKQYVLNSQGTIFADSADRIKINEVGAYALASKKFLKDVLKLTVSGRYDKNSNFKGRFTPRFSAVVKVAKDHNVRLSYQTAYRFPSTQNQWIDLEVGGGVQLIGGLPELRKFYEFDKKAVYTGESFKALAATGNPAVLVPQKFGEYKPESASSFEAGYKSVIRGKLSVDIYGYYTKYKNFIGRIAGVRVDSINAGGVHGQRIFSVSVNTAEEVTTHGWGISAEYALPLNFFVNANLFSDEISDVPANFITYYNTPKYRANIGFSNPGLLFKKRLGFNVSWRYQDGMDFQGDFISGYVPSFQSIDGQISYKLPSVKSMVKIGATNMTNRYYRNAIGNPQVGGLYYVSFGYNIF